MSFLMPPIYKPCKCVFLPINLDDIDAEELADAVREKLDARHRRFINSRIEKAILLERGEHLLDQLGWMT